MEGKDTERVAFEIVVTVAFETDRLALLKDEFSFPQNTYQWSECCERVKFTSEMFPPCAQREPEEFALKLKPDKNIKKNREATTNLVNYFRLF